MDPPDNDKLLCLQLGVNGVMFSNNDEPTLWEVNVLFSTQCWDLSEPRI